MKLTMKTVTITLLVLSTGRVVAYNPQHWHGKLGNTPQPNFVNRYQKPKKRGLTPWVSLNQIRQGNSFMNAPEGAPPPPPPHHPFGMPLPFGGTGIPIAPDPNPNDFHPMNVEDAQQMEEFRHFLFQDMMRMENMNGMNGMGMQGDYYDGDGDFYEPPQGFNDFANEDAWAWKKEHDMPHPGPPPPGFFNHQNNFDFDEGNTHVQHPMQGPGHANPMDKHSPLEPPKTNANAPQDPSLEALERMFRMKAYDKNQHKQDTQAPQASQDHSPPTATNTNSMEGIPSFDINDLPGFGGGHPLSPDMDQPHHPLDWKDEYKFDPTKYRNFDDTIINSYDENHFNPNDYDHHQQQSPQAPTPNRRLVRYRPNRSKSARASATNLGGAHQSNHAGPSSHYASPRPTPRTNIPGHHVPPPAYQPMQDPNQPFHQHPHPTPNNMMYADEPFFGYENHFEQYGPEYVDPAYFQPPPPPQYYPQEPYYGGAGGGYEHYENGYYADPYDPNNFPGEIDDGLLYY